MHIYNKYIHLFFIQLQEFLYLDNVRQIRQHANRIDVDEGKEYLVSFSMANSYIRTILLNESMGCLQTLVELLQKNGCQYVSQCRNIWDKDKWFEIFTDTLQKSVIADIEKFYDFLLTNKSTRSLGFFCYKMTEKCKTIIENNTGKLLL
jgi:hypothetical protein